MIIDNPSAEEKNSTFLVIDKYLEKNYKEEYVKYLDFGVKTVKLVCYSTSFIHLIKKQLPYVLKDDAEKYDAVLKIWQDENIGKLLTKVMDELNPDKNTPDSKQNIRLRAMKAFIAKKGAELLVFDDTYSGSNPIISYALWNNIFSASNIDTNTYYYCAKDTSPEEIIKDGHIFVQHINRILKADNINMIHGASIGINNNGILLCARGQRGKSTLSVLSMIKGFEYVSDDYLILEKDEDSLYTYPIYSIITLSPRMYNELFDELKDSRFLFNNARKDKYVISIANFHDRFRKKYPIRFCLFPEIVSDKEPSIVECSKAEKGRAIVQLIQSTVSQMQDINDHKVIKKLFDMVKDFCFYKINLCNDINKNTEFLREFTKNYQDRKSSVGLADMLVDVTFDIANLLDTKTYTIYTMNKLATAVYENLVNGVSKENIMSALSVIDGMPAPISENVDMLVKFLTEKNLLADISKTDDRKAYIKPAVAKECNYKMSVMEFKETASVELIK